MKKTFAVLLAAGAALPCVALAQEFGPLQGREINMSPNAAPPYVARGTGLQIVYDCLTNTFGNGSATHLGTCGHIIEDINLCAGPMCGDDDRTLTEITYGVAYITTNTATDIAIAFWDKDDVSYTGFGTPGAAMINPAARPFEVMRVALGNQNPGFYWQFTSSLAAFNGGAGVVVPEDQFVIQVVLLNAGAETSIVNDDPSTYPLGGVIPAASLYDVSATDRAPVFGSNSGAAVNGNSASPGSTTPSYGRDIWANVADRGTLIGSAIGAGGVGEHRFINASPQRGFMVRFRGLAPLPTPPNFIDLGCVTDGAATSAGTLADNTAQFYRLELCAGASAEDCLDKFLDADTEGSAADVAIAIWDATGNLLASNNDGGSGTADRLSAGIGRRAPVGDGLDYDGSVGELATGTYFVAVAPAGSGFGASFFVSPVGVGGNYNLNRNSNANAGAAFTLSAPTVVHGVTGNGTDYGQQLNAIDGFSTGPIVYGTDPSDARQGIALGTGLRGVLWNKFELTNEVSAAAGNYLDFEFTNLSTASADAVAYVFDSTGNIVAFSDDEGEAALPMLSWGSAGPRTYVTTNFPTPTVSYAGQNGTLAAGTYYMAFALFATDDADACLLSDDRFHVRGTSGSNLTVAADLFAGGPAGGGCVVTCDFNQDGGGDTSDVIDLADAIAAGTDPFPGSCIDFNQDGGGDTSDVIDMADAIASGTCP